MGKKGKMKNFNFKSPTQIVFGKGTIAKLDELLPQDQKILVTYGGGSIFKNGVYDQVKAALGDREVVEFGGIEANPTYETLMKAVDMVKQENVEFLLAVGGGSVLDGTKFIAAAVPFEGEDPWDLLKKNAPVKRAIPLASVLTLPATGSEMNSGSVISRKSTQEKLSFGDWKLAPQFSILDPETTYSLPKNQIRNGIVDSFIHVMEQYLTYPVNTPLQDRQAEAILKTLVEEADAILSEPADYDARATYMWSATNALNGTLSCGVVTDWATHVIGHEITAFYGLAHAETLAIVYPSLMHYKKEQKRDKILQYAQRVFGLCELPGHDLVEEAIRATEVFFHRIGMPTQLSDFGINAQEAAQKIRDRFIERGTKMGEHRDIYPEDVYKILMMAS